MRQVSDSSLATQGFLGFAIGDLVLSTPMTTAAIEQALRDYDLV